MVKNDKKADKATSRARNRVYGVGIVSTCVVVGLLAGFVGSWLENLTSTELGSSSQLISSKEDGNKVVTPNEESISAVAKSVSPSVVSILTSSRSTSPRSFNSQSKQGAGTGMIVSKNGYILTNKHVVKGVDNVQVVLTSGKSYDDVKIVGTDPLNDIAFLKINGISDAPAVTLGDSKTVRIGQSVIAIGNALGQYQNSVTSGIISGTGRPVLASTDGTSSGAESLTDLLQTDAAINSGNSGGPLLNLKGQVIGINTAIAQDAQGIGFAIPIGAAKGILNEVLETGKLRRPYLGVQYVSITPEVRAEYKLDVDKGDLVTATRGSSVQKNGPADKAGIKDGDIIIAVDGVAVGQGSSVSSLVSENRPGDKVDITVLRDGKKQKFTATLGVYNN